MAKWVASLDFLNSGSAPFSSGVSGAWGEAAGVVAREYMGHDVSNMRGFDSYRLLTLSLAALMTRISSAMIEGAHTSAGAATLARTGSLWGRFRSP